MTLTIFPFEKLPQIFQMIQFPFRMLQFSSFFFAIIAAINYGIVFKSFKKADVVILSIVSILLLIPYCKKIPKIDNFDETVLLSAIPVTEKTKRVHAGCASFEYLPSKAFDNKEYIINRNNEPIILEGIAQISEFIKDNSYLSFYVIAEEETRIELPYIYYKGYVAKINDTSIPVKESENGFASILIEKGEIGEIKVRYEGTLILKICYVISITSLILLLYCIILQKRKS